MLDGQKRSKVECRVERTAWHARAETRATNSMARKVFRQSVEPDMQERKHVQRDGSKERKHVQQIPWLEKPFDFFQFPVPVLLELCITVLLVLKYDYDA